MTCIVGIVDKANDKIYFGADSAGVAGYSLQLRADEKIFIKGDFIFGFTSSFRMGQILRYSFEPPKKYAEIDLYEYMVTTFIDAVRACFKKSGYMEIQNTVEIGGHFLVGYEGALFKVESDFQVGQSIDIFDATGCGQDVALGSMYTSVLDCNGYFNGEKVLMKALSSAERYSAGVRSPFLVLSIPIVKEKTEGEK